MKKILITIFVVCAFSLCLGRAADAFSIKDQLNSMMEKISDMMKPDVPTVTGIFPQDLANYSMTINEKDAQAKEYGIAIDVSFDEDVDLEGISQDDFSLVIGKIEDQIAIPLFKPSERKLTMVTSLTDPWDDTLFKINSTAGYSLSLKLCQFSDSTDFFDFCTDPFSDAENAAKIEKITEGDDAGKTELCALLVRTDINPADISLFEKKTDGNLSTPVDKKEIVDSDLCVIFESTSGILGATYVMHFGKYTSPEFEVPGSIITTVTAEAFFGEEVPEEVVTPPEEEEAQEEAPVEEEAPAEPTVTLEQEPEPFTFAEEEDVTVEEEPGISPFASWAEGGCSLLPNTISSGLGALLIISVIMLAPLAVVRIRRRK